MPITTISSYFLTFYSSIFCGWYFFGILIAGGDRTKILMYFVFSIFWFFHFVEREAPSFPLKNHCQERTLRIKDVSSSSDKGGIWGSELFLGIPPFLARFFRPNVEKMNLKLRWNPQKMLLKHSETLRRQTRFWDSLQDAPFDTMCHLE